MLVVGGDAAVARNSINCKTKITDILLIGTLNQYRRFANNIMSQPFKIKNIAQYYITTKIYYHFIVILNYQQTYQNKYGQLQV